MVSLMASISEIMTAATEHHRAGRLESAVQGYREVLKLDPKLPNAWHMLGVLTSQQGNSSEAIGYMERAVSLRPDDMTIQRNLGVIKESMRDFSGAIACYRKVLNSQPGNAAAHYCLANGLRAGGRLDEALEHFRKAIELKPDMAEAHNNVGSLFKQKGEIDEAMSSYLGDRGETRLCGSLPEFRRGFSVCWKEGVGSCYSPTGHLP